MTLQELRFVIALAREKHFRKAADACFVSQPTLSVAIQKLEKELGVILFERFKNEVRITPIGTQVVEEGQRALAAIENIKKFVKSDQDPLAGVFKIGAIYTVGPYLLPPLVTALHLLAPQMPLEIEENYTSVLRNKLVAGDLDAIIVSLPFTEPGVVTHILYKESFVVLMPSDHPLAKNKSIKQDELAEHSLLMLDEGHCLRDQIVSSCPQCFTPISKTQSLHWKTISGSSLETIRHMVASKMGVTILPETAAINTVYHANILTTRPLKDTSPSRVIALAWRQSFPRTKAIDVIIKAVSKHFHVTPEKNS